MSDDYLWDRTGTPDPDIVQLEQALGTLAYKQSPLRRDLVWRPLVAFAAAACAVVAIALTLLQTVHTPAVWELAGTKTYVGQVLRTSDSSVLLEADEFGRVEVAPASEVRITESHAARQRLSLERGTIHALIWAPPQKFVVDTGSARAIDLGCQYSLTVDKQGTGLLRVETGWVAFQHEGRESFIPAGAACHTRSTTGPGLPYFEDASEAFRAALVTYDVSCAPDALMAVLKLARPRDGLSVWHVLTRAPADQRGIVFDRFATLVAVPPPVTRAAVVAGNRTAFDACWNALNLENTEWWREWKRQW